MIKKDIINYLYDHHGGITRDEADRYTNTLLEILQDAMVENDNVTISGFGRFRHKRRTSREVVMPNGERRRTSEGERIQFLPSPKLKSFINSDDN